MELRNGRLRGMYVSAEERRLLAVAEPPVASPKEAARSDPSPGAAPGVEEPARDPAAGSGPDGREGGRVHGPNP